jgi:hypothetical protein
MERGSDTNEIADMNVQKERIKEEHYAREMIIIRNIILSKELRTKLKARFHVA